MTNEQRNLDDIHVSRGPVSSMPGSSHRLPSGAVCDDHPDRPAVARIQGETDSFGCEYILMCDECHAKFRVATDADRIEPKRCDWCHEVTTGVVPHRDYDEGMAGPVYQVCPACIAKESENAQMELDERDEDPFAAFMYDDLDGVDTRHDDY